LAGNNDIGLIFKSKSELTDLYMKRVASSRESSSHIMNLELAHYPFNRYHGFG